MNHQKYLFYIYEKLNVKTSIPVNVKIYWNQHEINKGTKVMLLKLILSYSGWFADKKLFSYKVSE